MKNNTSCTSPLLSVSFSAIRYRINVECWRNLGVLLEIRRRVNWASKLGSFRENRASWHACNWLTCFFKALSVSRVFSIAVSSSWLLDDVALFSSWHKLLIHVKLNKVLSAELTLKSQYNTEHNIIIISFLIKLVILTPPAVSPGCMGNHDYNAEHYGWICLIMAVND